MSKSQCTKKKRTYTEQADDRMHESLYVNAIR